ncbi:hypothetical protein JCM3765_007763, partial [Sporobolomyces pararoseus]
KISHSKEVPTDLGQQQQDSSPATSRDQQSLFPQVEDPLTTSTPDPESPPPLPSITLTPPLSTMSKSTTSVSSATAALSLFATNATKLGPISLSNWPEWEEALLRAIVGITGDPFAGMELNGELEMDDEESPPYEKSKLKEIRKDPARLEAFTKWVKMASTLKDLVLAHGGTDAAAKVSEVEVKFGDAKAVWKVLKDAYSSTETGANNVATLVELFTERWNESTEAPSSYFSRIRLLQKRLNTNYRSAALASTDDTDKNIISDRNAALSDFLIRDIALAFLPEDYNENILHLVNKTTTTLSTLEQLVGNRYNTRVSREKITEVDARRAEASYKISESRAVESSKNSKGNGRGYAARNGSKKVSAKTCANYKNWRGGTFVDSNGVERFSIPRGTCFKCWKDGHLVAGCPLKGNEEKLGKSRIEELAKNGVSTGSTNVMALLVFDENDNAQHDHAVTTALRIHYQNSRNSSSPSSPPPSPHSNFEQAHLVTIEGDPLYGSASETVKISAHAFVLTPAILRYILDSGASRHFTTFLSQLLNYVPYPRPRKINGAFGVCGEAFGEGSIVLESDCGNPVTLHGVMYAPKLGVNLISQTQMMLSGYSFTNNRRTLTITDPSNSKVVDLLVAPTIEIKASRLPSPPVPSALAVKLTSDHLLLQHYRLGHPSDSRLKKSLGYWNGDEKVSSLCSHCAVSKATRIGVSKVSDDRATKKLERISADTWTSPVRGMQNERYAVIMIDTWSRYAWLEVVNTKGGIAELVKDRLKREERSEGIQVVAFQSDNGTEFVNSTLNTFLKSKGIVHRRTVPYAHNQNGLVERRWRQLLEIVRSLFSASKLPLSFWPYALSTAVHIYNQSSSSAIDNMSPYEKYYGKAPSRDMEKVWGCSAWLALPREGSYRVNKLEDRAVFGRFLGYTEDRKGWKFWVPKWRKVVVWIEVYRWNEFKFGNEGVQTSEEDYNRWVEGLDEEIELEKDVVPEGGNEVRREQLLPLPQPRPPADIVSDNPFAVLENEQDSSSSQEIDPHPQSSSPPPLPQIPPPTPPVIEPRQSLRLRGEAPSHFRSLPSSNSSRSRLSRSRSHTFNSEIAATLTLSDTASENELQNALYLALATSPTWDGNHDSPAYWELKGRPDINEWQNAMADELAAFDATGTWDENLVELPKDRKAIAVKWVLLIKRDTEGKVIKYKARLVARGDMQVDGIDFDETHSSTVRLSTVRLTFALLAANPNWKLAQFDISNAYLLGNLDREIYIKQPQGFSDPSKPNHVRRLRKALYGLKQGGREWQKVLRTALEEIGFKRCDSDHGLYVRRQNGKVAMIPTHVDDGLMMGDDDLDKALDDLNIRLDNKLKKIETGVFLGMKITRHEDGIVEIDQSHYVKTILDRFFPEGLSTVVTPLDSSYSHLVAVTEEDRFDCPYRELLGALVYLSACTRPDLAFALSFLSRFASCPGKQHFSALTHLCRYLNGTRNLGLRYLTPSVPFSADLLTGWSDADHGADKDSRRSVSGYVFGIGEDSTRTTAISWMSKRQKSVAISSTEAEYMALSEAAREAIWLRQLLKELGYEVSKPTLIRGDNSGSLLLASHPTSHSRTKHIAIHYHFTRELVNDNTVVLKWVPTDEMVADVFTKGLPRVKHVIFTSRAGLKDLRRKGGCENEVASASEDVEKKIVET